MSDTNEVKAGDRRRQVRDMMTDRRLSTDDRRQIEEIMEENDDLREKVRRLEDRKGGDSNFFGNLMIISLILFVLAVLANFGIPPYIESQISMPYDIRMGYMSWVSVAGIGLWAFPILACVFWFFKKR
jgi:hypothetical protein